MSSEPDERPTVPVRSTDEEDRGWGDEVPADDGEDVRRLLAERPPHHDERDEA